MKRLTLTIFAIALTSLIASSGLWAASPLQMKVTPQVAQHGGSVRVSVTIEKSPRNTQLILQWVGPQSGETKKELFGEASPYQIVFDRQFRNLPDGAYEVTIMLYRTFDEQNKAETFVARQQFLVGTPQAEEDLP